MRKPTIQVRDHKELHAEMIKQGYSVRSFCNKSGISNPTLYYIIDGTRNPSARTANLIALYLGKQFEELFEIKIEEAAQ